jgi:branched-chain amino acid transport system ATP-binding protein
VITGVFSPNNGSIRFRGEDIVGLKPHRVAKKGIIRTFQKDTVFSNFSVFDNLVIAKHMEFEKQLWKGLLKFRRADPPAAADLTEILSLTGLDAYKDRLAGNLDTGWRRVLALATALSANPRLLLLDEPITTLTPKMVEVVMDLICKVRDRGTTVMLVEHNMGPIMDHCNRIVVLNFGKKIADDVPKRIQENKDVIEAYLGG